MPQLASTRQNMPELAAGYTLTNKSYHESKTNIGTYRHFLKNYLRIPPGSNTFPWFPKPSHDLLSLPMVAQTCPWLITLFHGAFDFGDCPYFISDVLPPASYLTSGSNVNIMTIVTTVTKRAQDSLHDI